MKLIINGDHKEFEGDKSLGDIIKELQIEDKVMASAVNMQIVKKDDWKTFILQDGDRIELLQFVGGG